LVGKLNCDRRCGDGSTRSGVQFPKLRTTDSWTCLEPAMSQAANVLKDHISQFRSEVQNPRWSGIASRLLWALDALLTVAILFKVPCTYPVCFLAESLDTEIDWKAYMEQVAQIVQGERDYALIKGGTGPLWYGHSNE